MQLLDAIKQRKTIKLFQQNHLIPRSILEEMLNIAQLAPSKANLQPWRFVVIDEPQSKTALLDHVAFNRPPCETASALVLVLADLQYSELIEQIVECSISRDCLQPEFKDRTIDFLTHLDKGLNDQARRDQILIDASLAAMQLMLAAKQQGYDTHAIGVFDREAVFNILQIDSARYVSVMLIAIGKAAVPALPSTRLPLDCTTVWNSGNDLGKCTLYK